MTRVAARSEIGRSEPLRGVATKTGNGHAPGGETVFDRQLLEALFAFRNGDFTVRLPADIAGIDGKIADTFNDILAVAQRRAAETARVCRVVGKEGKLRQRLRVPGTMGGWTDEVTELNTLIDDLVWPTLEITRAVGAVGKGELGE